MAITVHLNVKPCNPLLLFKMKYLVLNFEVDFEKPKSREEWGGKMVVWGRELAAGGWSNGGEPEEEVASGVVGVWEQVLGELGLVGGGAVSSGRSWWALGDAGAWLGVFKVCRGSSGVLGLKIVGTIKLLL